MQTTREPPLPAPTPGQRVILVHRSAFVSSSNMGHRRFALLGLAVVVLFAVDGAAAASKGAPRAGGHRRASKTAGSRPSRSQRDKQDDREFQDWDGDARKGPRSRTSPVSKPSRGTRSGGSGSSRVRPSSTGSSRSSSRLVLATRGNAKRPQCSRACLLQPTVAFHCALGFQLETLDLGKSWFLCGMKFHVLLWLCCFG